MLSMPMGTFRSSVASLGAMRKTFGEPGKLSSTLKDPGFIPSLPPVLFTWNSS